VLDKLFFIKEVEGLLSKSQNITILTHLNPDADTLGTGLGIYNLLKKDKSKKIEIVNASKSLPKYLDFLPSYEKIKHKIDFEDSLIITCDAGSIDRLGFDVTDREILNIDHHKSNHYYGEVNVVDEMAASASQVAYALFKQIYEIDASVATCFYAGLLSDTQYFTTNLVDKEVFEIANALVEAGANPSEIAFHFRQRCSLSALRILEKALHSLTLYHEAKIAVITITQEDIVETGAIMPDMEGLVDYAKSLATVEIAFCVVELEKGAIRVSLRSKGVDVEQVASAFGGGGHKVAAGFTLEESQLQESIDTILKKINNLGVLNGKKS